jgi:hypothetical protein
MSLTCYEPAALPQWFVVFALVALSPVPLSVPSGIALAAIGLLGSAFLVRAWRHQQRVPVSCRPGTANGTDGRP